MENELNKFKNVERQERKQYKPNKVLVNCYYSSDERIKDNNDYFIGGDLDLIEHVNIIFKKNYYLLSDTLRFLDKQDIKIELWKNKCLYKNIQYVRESYGK